MSNRTLSLRWLLLVSVFLLAIPLTFGSVGGSISGLVTDPSGAVIAGAEVVALNTATGIKQTVKTDAAGFYSFPSLPIGPYEIDVRQAGFKEFRATGLVIDANTALRVDATLQVGTVTQEVSVSATAVQVDTSSTQVGEVIGSTAMEVVPLNGRSFVDLMALQPGVVPTTVRHVQRYRFRGARLRQLLGQRGARICQWIHAERWERRSRATRWAPLSFPTLTPSRNSASSPTMPTRNTATLPGGWSTPSPNPAPTSSTEMPLTSSAIPTWTPGTFTLRFARTLQQERVWRHHRWPHPARPALLLCRLPGKPPDCGRQTAVQISVPSAQDLTGNLSDSGEFVLDHRHPWKHHSQHSRGTDFASQLATKLGYPVTVGEPYYTPGCTSSANCVFPGAVIPQSAWASPAAPLIKYIPAPNTAPRVLRNLGLRRYLAG